MLKQSFAIDCYDERKLCHDHFASYVTSSQILFNPAQIRPLRFFWFFDRWGGGGFWRSASCNFWSITVMRDHGTKRFYSTFKTVTSRSSILNDDVIWRTTGKILRLGSAIFDFVTYKTPRNCQNYLIIYIFFSTYIFLYLSEFYHYAILSWTQFRKACLFNFKKKDFTNWTHSFLQIC